MRVFCCNHLLIFLLVQAHLILLGVAKNKVILRSFMLILVLVADLLTDVKNEP